MYHALVLCLHRAKDATLLLVASDIGTLYVFSLQPLDATHNCELLNEFQLCSSSEMSVCCWAVSDSKRFSLVFINVGTDLALLCTS